jgi:hypothetical protein
LTIFACALPVRSVLRVWDTFLAEGWAAIHAVSLAILSSVQTELLALPPAACMNVLLRINSRVLQSLWAQQGDSTRGRDTVEGKEDDDGEESVVTGDDSFRLGAHEHRDDSVPLSSSLRVIDEVAVEKLLGMRFHQSHVLTSTQTKTHSLESAQH